MTYRQKMIAKAKELGLELKINTLNNKPYSVSIDFPPLTSSPSYEASIVVPRDEFNNEPTENFYKHILNDELATIEKEGLEPCYSHDCCEIHDCTPSPDAQKGVAYLEVPFRQLTVVFQYDAEADKVDYQSYEVRNWSKPVVIEEMGTAYFFHDENVVFGCPVNSDDTIAWEDYFEIEWSSFSEAEKALIHAKLDTLYEPVPEEILSSISQTVMDERNNFSTCEAKLVFEDSMFCEACSARLIRDTDDDGNDRFICSRCGMENN